MTGIVRLPITMDNETKNKALKETLHLARSLGLSSYDAAYLELAVRLGLPLATMDNKLAGAALEIGVDVLPGGLR